MKGEKKRMSKEEEAVETALAAAGAALFVSGVKKLLPCFLRQWPALLVAPSPLLFVLLHLIIASIVIISIHPKKNILNDDNDSRKNEDTEKKSKRNNRARTVLEVKQNGFCTGSREGEEEEDAEELNARAEAFIVAFKQQLRLDSFRYSGYSSPTRIRTPSC